ncbi:MAG: PLP-dependent aminotransferase family protein [Pseudomonadales bacterium]|nr:PLP-dependent aminotransferase family protein [Pseudomonadales bacterium]
MRLYEKVAESLAQEIEGGQYPFQQRLPGVRKLAEIYGVSVSTVLEGLALLENRRYVEVRERSGHYVCYRQNIVLELPRSAKSKMRPRPISSHEMALNLVGATMEKDIVQLGAAVPHSDYLPSKEVNRSVKAICKEEEFHSAGYDFPPGYAPLCEQLALRMQSFGRQLRGRKSVSHSDIVITSGCQAALTLALKLCCQPGDIVAIESPTFYVLLQIIESLGLKAIEIPTHPESGLNVGALRLALEQWPVKACILIPHFGNPLGHLMSEEDKLEFLSVIGEYDLPVIEDDIYGDLSFSQERPVPMIEMGYDNVIYCSSFSKTISPGLRVGWIASKRYQDKLEYLQYVNSLSASTLSQRALSHYLAKGTYDSHLRRVRMTYRHQIQEITRLIEKYFPGNTKVSQPAGGFVLWLELSRKVDTLELYRAALTKKISVAPGPMFSASGKYKNYLRLNCALPLDGRLEWAIMTLADLVEVLQDQ